MVKRGKALLVIPQVNSSGVFSALYLFFGLNVFTKIPSEYRGGTMSRRLSRSTARQNNGDLRQSSSARWVNFIILKKEASAKATGPGRPLIQGADKNKNKNVQ